MDPISTKRKPTAKEILEKIKEEAEKDKQERSFKEKTENTHKFDEKLKGLEDLREKLQQNKRINDDLKQEFEDLRTEIKENTKSQAEEAKIIILEVPEIKRKSQEIEIGQNKDIHKEASEYLKNYRKSKENIENNDNNENIEKNENIENNENNENNENIENIEKNNENYNENNENNENNMSFSRKEERKAEKIEENNVKSMKQLEEIITKSINVNKNDQSFNNGHSSELENVRINKENDGFLRKKSENILENKEKVLNNERKSSAKPDFQKKPDFQMKSSEPLIKEKGWIINGFISNKEPLKYETQRQESSSDIQKQPKLIEKDLIPSKRSNNKELKNTQKPSFSSTNSDIQIPGKTLIDRKPSENPPRPLLLDPIQKEFQEKERSIQKEAHQKERSIQEKERYAIQEKERYAIKEKERYSIQEKERYSIQKELQEKERFLVWLEGQMQESETQRLFLQRKLEDLKEENDSLLKMNFELTKEKTTLKSQLENLRKETSPLTPLTTLYSTQTSHYSKEKPLDMGKPNGSLTNSFRNSKKNENHEEFIRKISDLLMVSNGNQEEIFLEIENLGKIKSFSKGIEENSTFYGMELRRKIEKIEAFFRLFDISPNEDFIVRINGLYNEFYRFQVFFRVFFQLFIMVFKRN